MKRFRKSRRRVVGVLFCRPDKHYGKLEFDLILCNLKCCFFLVLFFLLLNSLSCFSFFLVLFFGNCLGVVGLIYGHAGDCINLFHSLTRTTALALFLARKRHVCALVKQRFGLYRFFDDLALILLII